MGLNARFWVLVKKMKKRNSLIELYRFFFALNVVKNHGFFPEGFNYFSPGRVSVEFFFVLSGFLFYNTLVRMKDMPLGESLPKLIVSKLRPLLFPLVIGLLSNILYEIISPEPFSGIWGYLWYVHAMIVTMIGYLVIRRLVKSDRAFLYVTLGIFIVATLMRFSGIFYSWGYVRAASTISLGLLLARLPRLRIKKWIIWLMLAPVAAACFVIVCFHLGNTEWFGGFMGVELILDLVLYPALIYLSFNIDFSLGIFNYLGALSFGLYAFQCPADLLRLLGLDSRVVLLIIIVALSVAEDGVKRLIRYYRNKRENAKSEVMAA